MHTRNKFRGSMTALVTPFRNGSLDESALRALVNWQIQEGTTGLIPAGTTGESPTLSHAEHKRAVEIVVEEAKGRVPVIAGAGSNSTLEAIDFAHHAEEAGADALLVVTPYYNKPTQEGLYAHYKAINDATKLPIFIYNIPGRSVIDMSVETMARLSKLPNIIGTKDATAKIERASDQALQCGHEFVQLSGDDFTALGFNAQGGVGCISVTSNIAPRLCADMQRLSLSGDYAAARPIHETLMALHNVMFIESNPAPVKYALSLMGKCTAEVRLPLVPLQESSKQKIKAALEKVGLL